MLNPGVSLGYLEFQPRPRFSHRRRSLARRMARRQDGESRLPARGLLDRRSLLGSTRRDPRTPGGYWWDRARRRPVNNMATDTAQAPIAHALVKPPTLAHGEYIYNIESGDSLLFIAGEHGVTVEALKARNAVTLARWKRIRESHRAENPESCEGIIWVNEGIVIPAGGTPPQEETEPSEDIAQ